jgi:hypothetical protein
MAAFAEICHFRNVKRSGSSALMTGGEPMDGSRLRQQSKGCGSARRNQSCPRADIGLRRMNPTLPTMDLFPSILDPALKLLPK